MTRSVEGQPGAPADAALAALFDYESIPAGYYDEVFRRNRGVQSKWHHLKFERVARELAGYRRVLDVGCGPGTMIGHLGPDHESVGVDLSIRQIEYARTIYGPSGARFYAETPARLPEDEPPFDAVTLVELIEHLTPLEVDATIREALGRLRPGGKLVVTTPNFRSAWPLVEAAVNRFAVVTYDVQHINRFGPARLRGLLEHHALEHPRVERYMFLAPFAAALGWGVADRVARLERGTIEQRVGMLLVGSAVKPG